MRQQFEANHFALLQYEGVKKRFPAARKGCDGLNLVYPGVDCTSNKSSANYELALQGASALVYILPYIEEQALFDQFRVDVVSIWNSDTTSTWYLEPDVKIAIGTRPATYVCPSDGDLPIFAEYKHVVPARVDVTTGSYANVAGTLGANSGNLKYANDGVFFYNRRIKGV